MRLAGIPFEECKKVIDLEVEQGWQSKQIVTPTNQESEINAPICYQIIFEREI